MGYASVLSRAQVGLVAPVVRVEVHVGGGLPQFGIVGLPAPVVRESKDRVRAALASGGFDFPAGRITVNLAPAELPKEGGRYDLPIALGILIASGQVRPRIDLETMEFYGELGLTGELKAVQALLLSAWMAGHEGRRLCGPAGNLRELQLLNAEAGWLAADLATVIARLEGREKPAAPESAPALAVKAAPPPDIADVRGQQHPKRALLIAAAGGHHLLFQGPPGAGKSLLAQRLNGLLPRLTEEEHREVAAIHSLRLGPTELLPEARPPFRSPHHTASAHAIVGGGKRASPGEISLAHRGVLFMDELPEFDRRVLEALREPLETGQVCIARADLRAEYPAQFQLVAAMNGCPCGLDGVPLQRCECSPKALQRYRARLSGPLLDRIDLQIQVKPVGPALWEENGAGPAERSVELAVRVAAARTRQIERQGCLNARLGPSDTLERCRLRPEAVRLLARTADRFGLSARTCHRVARLARTIADLEGDADVGATAVLEGASFRIAAQRDVM